MTHKPLHRIAPGIQFVRGTNDGFCPCTCGWSGLCSEFADHRSSRGAPARYIDSARFEGAGSWASTLTVGNNRPLHRDKVPA